MLVELTFVWVLAMPKETHVFDTKKACEAFRKDQAETYGMNVPKCHKEVLK